MAMLLETKEGQEPAVPGLFCDQNVRQDVCPNHLLRFGAVQGLQAL